MRFLCDVHISYKLKKHLNVLGFEAIHVNQILDHSETKDSDLCRYADQNDYVIITKDADFRDSFFVSKKPKKLIKINLGNISNQHLISLINGAINTIQKLDEKPGFLLEIDKKTTKLFEI